MNKLGLFALGAVVGAIGSAVLLTKLIEHCRVVGDVENIDVDDEDGCEAVRSVEISPDMCRETLDFLKRISSAAHVKHGSPSDTKSVDCGSEHDETNDEV